MKRYFRIFTLSFCLLVMLSGIGSAQMRTEVVASADVMISSEGAEEIFRGVYPNVEVDSIRLERRGNQAFYFIFGTDKKHNYKMEVDAVSGEVILKKKIRAYKGYQGNLTFW